MFLAFINPTPAIVTAKLTYLFPSTEADAVGVIEKATDAVVVVVVTDTSVEQDSVADVAAATMVVVAVTGLRPTVGTIKATKYGGDGI